MSHRRDGVIRPESLSDRTPSRDRMAAGPVAVIECIENIPCNPCVEACPRGAIAIEGDINDTPRVDPELCNGCTLCLSACPGLAIFVIDASGDGSRATVVLPYEYLPLPEVGETVEALDRSGEPVCEATVTRVMNTKALDRTPIVSIDVPKGSEMAVRHFRRKDTAK